MVDDVVVNRVLAMAFLNRLGLDAHEVDGGRAALGWIRNNGPVDVVLLDISMPDLNGEEVCQLLRADPSCSALKIVAYTAHAGPDDADRFLANGFDAVLIKPISMQRLTDVLAKLF